MKRVFGSCLLFFGLLLTACTAATPQTVSSPTPTSPKAVSAPVQNEWDRLVEEARKEGNLTVIGTSLGATKQIISQLFKTRYGVSIGYIDGRGAEVVAKVLTERRAGLYSVDVGQTGDSTYLVDLKSNDVTVPLEQVLFLPDVVDGSKWKGGQLPFIDQDRTAMAFSGIAVPMMIINTDVVKPNEIMKHADLLNAKWKGKIVIGDPTTSGTGNNWFTHVVTQLYPSQEAGLQFMKDLAKQDPVITRDVRLVSEWVARAKYPIGIGQSMPVTTEFVQAGAPIAYGGRGERSFLSSGAGLVYLFSKAPHPNAAKLYINWILSKEGAEIWTPAFGVPSLRMDVDAVNGQFDPAFIPPNDSVMKREAYILVQAEMRKVAQDVFKEQLK